MNRFRTFTILFSILSGVTLFSNQAFAQFIGHADYGNIEPTAADNQTSSFVIPPGAVAADLASVFSKTSNPKGNYESLQNLVKQLYSLDIRNTAKNTGAVQNKVVEIFNFISSINRTIGKDKVVNAYVVGQNLLSCEFGFSEPTRRLIAASMGTERLIGEPTDHRSVNLDLLSNKGADLWRSIPAAKLTTEDETKAFLATGVSKGVGIDSMVGVLLSQNGWGQLAGKGINRDNVKRWAERAACGVANDKFVDSLPDGYKKDQGISEILANAGKRKTLMDAIRAIQLASNGPEGHDQINAAVQSAFRLATKNTPTPVHFIKLLNLLTDTDRLRISKGDNSKESLIRQALLAEVQLAYAASPNAIERGITTVLNTPGNGQKFLSALQKMHAVDGNAFDAPHASGAQAQLDNFRQAYQELRGIGLPPNAILRLQPSTGAGQANRVAYLNSMATSSIGGGQFNEACAENANWKKFSEFYGTKSTEAAEHLKNFQKSNLSIPAEYNPHLEKLYSIMTEKAKGDRTHGVASIYPMLKHLATDDRKISDPVPAIFCGLDAAKQGEYNRKLRSSIHALQKRYLEGVIEKDGGPGALAVYNGLKNLKVGDTTLSILDALRGLTDPEGDLTKDANFTSALDRLKVALTGNTQDVAMKREMIRRLLQFGYFPPDRARAIAEALTGHSIPMQYTPYTVGAATGLPSAPIGFTPPTAVVQNPLPFGPSQTGLVAPPPGFVSGGPFVPNAAGGHFGGAPGFQTGMTLDQLQAQNPTGTGGFTPTSGTATQILLKNHLASVGITPPLTDLEIANWAAMIDGAKRPVGTTVAANVIYAPAAQQAYALFSAALAKGMSWDKINQLGHAIIAMGVSPVDASAAYCYLTRERTGNCQLLGPTLPSVPIVPTSPLVFAPTVPLVAQNEITKNLGTLRNTSNHTAAQVEAANIIDRLTGQGVPPQEIKNALAAVGVYGDVFNALVDYKTMASSNYAQFATDFRKFRGYDTSGTPLTENQKQALSAFEQQYGQDKRVADFATITQLPYGIAAGWLDNPANNDWSRIGSFLASRDPLEHINLYRHLQERARAGAPTLSGAEQKMLLALDFLVARRFGHEGSSCYWVLRNQQAGATDNTKAYCAAADAVLKSRQANIGNIPSGAGSELTSQTFVDGTKQLISSALERNGGGIDWRTFSPGMRQTATATYDQRLATPWFGDLQNKTGGAGGRISVSQDAQNWILGSGDNATTPARIFNWINGSLPSNGTSVSKENDARWKEASVRKAAQFIQKDAEGRYFIALRANGDGGALSIPGTDGVPADKAGSREIRVQIPDSAIQTNGYGSITVDPAAMERVLMGVKGLGLEQKERVQQWSAFNSNPNLSGLNNFAPVVRGVGGLDPVGSGNAVYVHLQEPTSGDNFTLVRNASVGQQVPPPVAPVYAPTHSGGVVGGPTVYGPGGAIPPPGIFGAPLPILAPPTGTGFWGAPIGGPLPAPHGTGGTGNLFGGFGDPAPTGGLPPGNTVQPPPTGGATDNRAAQLAAIQSAGGMCISCHTSVGRRPAGGRDVATAPFSKSELATALKDRAMPGGTAVPANILQVIDTAGVTPADLDNFRDGRLGRTEVQSLIKYAQANLIESTTEKSTAQKGLKKSRQASLRLMPWTKKRRYYAISNIQFRQEGFHLPG